MVQKKGKRQKTEGILGPPVVPVLTHFLEGSPTKIDYKRSWYPYSNLSTTGVVVVSVLFKSRLQMPRIKRVLPVSTRSLEFCLQSLSLRGHVEKWFRFKPPFGVWMFPERA